MNYVVTVEGTLRIDINVEANSEAEACETAACMYDGGQAVLDINDLEDVTFNVFTAKDSLLNLPKVLVFSDDSFGTDTLEGLDITNYRLGYYEIPAKLNPLFNPTTTHEVDSSEFYMDADEFEAYTDEAEFLSDYDKDLKNFRQMLYRQQ